MDAEDRVIGKGIKFPVDVSRGYTATNDGVERINQSIYIILSTVSGELWFNPGFGSNLRKWLFDPNNRTTEFLIIEDIKEALDRNEPRITVKEITIERNNDTGEVYANIQYVIKATGKVANCIYPLRREPGGPFYSRGLGVSV